MSRAKTILKEFLTMLALMIAIVGVGAGALWLEWFFLESKGPISSVAYLGGLIGLVIVIVRFFANIRPLFTDGAVQGFGCGVGLLGVAVGFSPILIARLTTPPGENWLSEASGGGSAIWLMIYSLPFGFIIGVVGLRIFNAASARSKKAMQNPDELGDLQ